MLAAHPISLLAWYPGPSFLTEFVRLQPAPAVSLCGVNALTSPSCAPDGAHGGPLVKIAVGTPATIPGVAGDLMLEWSRRADAGSFSSLVFVDRIVYPNYEVMTAMGAAAAVTSRIRLMPTILIGPL